MDQVRYLKALPEVRRVIRRLTDSTISDKNALAGIKRAINVSGLNFNFETVAAKRSIVAPGPETGSNSKRTSPAPKSSTNKSVVKETPPAPKKRAPKSSPNTINIRGGGMGGEVTVEKSLNVKTQKQVQELSDLLAVRQDRLNVAEHIKSLLAHHFDNDDPVVVRMSKHINALVKESQDLVEEIQEALHSIGTNYFSQGFKETVENIYNALDKQFEGKFKNFNKKFTIAQGTFKGHPSTFYICYLIFDDLRGNVATQDYVVVVTQVVENIGNQNLTNKKAKGASTVGLDKAKAENYIRTLTDYRPPTWIIRHPLGIAFGADENRAIRSVLLTMQSEDMLDAINKSGVPIKNEHIKFNSTMVDGAKILEDEDKLRVYLDPEITDSNVAQDALSTLYAEVKAMIKVVHPRYKNPIRVMQPKLIRTKRKMDDGEVHIVERFAIDFVFAKPEGEQDIELPRDKIKKFMEIFDIEDPNMARDFSAQLKRFLGVK